MNTIHIIVAVVILIILLIAYYMFLAPVHIDLSKTTQANLIMWTQFGNSQRCLYKKIAPGVLVGPTGTVNSVTMTPYLLIYNEETSTDTYYYGLLMYAPSYDYITNLFATNGAYYENGSVSPTFYGNTIVSLNPANVSHVNMRYITRLGLCNLLKAGTNVQNTAAMGPTSSAVTATAANKLSYSPPYLVISYE